MVLIELTPEETALALKGTADVTAIQAIRARLPGTRIGEAWAAVKAARGDATPTPGVRAPTYAEECDALLSAYHSGAAIDCNGTLSI